MMHKSVCGVAWGATPSMHTKVPDDVRIPEKPCGESCYLHCLEQVLYNYAAIATCINCSVDNECPLNFTHVPHIYSLICYVFL